MYNIELIKKLVGAVRDARNQDQLKPKEILELLIKDSEAARAFFATEGMKAAIEKIAFVSISFTAEDEHEGANFIVGTEQYYLVFEKKIDVEKVRNDLQSELKRLQGFIKGIEKKLGNERFVSNAPAAVVEKERKKMADNHAKIKLIEENLAKLN